MRGMYCLILLICIFPGSALAHRVILFAWVEEGMVHVEGGFGGKKPAINCDIKAFDKENSLIFQGKTDEKGNCTFKIPLAHNGEMTLELNAGPGHKGVWTIGEDELASGRSDTLPDDSEQHKVLENGVDPIKAVAGVGIIFCLALGVALIKKRKKGGLGD